VTAEAVGGGAAAAGIAGATTAIATTIPMAARHNRHDRDGPQLPPGMAAHAIGVLRPATSLQLNCQPGGTQRPFTEGPCNGEALQLTDIGRDDARHRR